MDGSWLDGVSPRRFERHGSIPRKMEIPRRSGAAPVCHWGRVGIGFFGDGYALVCLTMVSPLAVHDRLQLCHDGLYPMVLVLGRVTTARVSPEPCEMMPSSVPDVGSAIEPHSHRGGALVSCKHDE